MTKRVNRTYNHELGMDVWSAKDDSMWVDPDRTRTKREWPYSYDEFFIFGTREEVADKFGVYSDRMVEWDRPAFMAALKPFAKRFDRFDRKDADEFLTAYYKKPTKCYGLAEGCNPSSGYPYHIFWFEHVLEIDGQCEEVPEMKRIAG